ncbi:MAG: hypothetical protein U0797_17060 [Gemmataceae bacterium]
MPTRPGCGLAAADARTPATCAPLLLQAPPAAAPTRRSRTTATAERTANDRPGGLASRRRGRWSSGRTGEPGGAEGKRPGDQRRAKPSAGRDGIPPVERADAPPLSGADAAAAEARQRASTT